MSSSIMDWEPITKAWLKDKPTVMSEVLLPAFESVFPSKCMDSLVAYNTVIIKS